MNTFPPPGSPPPPPPALPPLPSGSGGYPASFDVRTPDPIARWRPIVQPFLAIPHLLISGAMGYVSEALSVVSWFAILFTGRLPSGLAGFQVMVQRYSTRASTYAAGLTDQYPPFEFSTADVDPGTTPTQVTIRPSIDGRNRLTVAFRIILAIPAVLWAGLLGIAAVVCWFIGVFAVLITGRWPDGLRNVMVGAGRVSVRTNAYVTLLTDEYPPFSL